MKSNLKLLLKQIFCVVPLGIGSFFSLAAEINKSAGTPPAETAISWSQLGATAGAGPTFSDANWNSMGGMAGTDGSVSAAVVDGSSNLYIGGEFTVAGEVIANRVAKWNGNSWTALGSGLSGGGDYPSVYALAVSGSDLYVGGRFTTAGGNPATNVAKWNGSSWSALGSGLNGTVSALAVSGSNVYVEGDFTTAGGKAAINIAKWDGSSWSALGSGLNGSVSALAVSGSDLYVGGDFTTAGSKPARSIAKWDGSSWSALGSGLNGSVSALAVSGSDLYVGGDFTAAGGSTGTNIAKWNGSSWSALGSGIAWGVLALTAAGNEVYAGGSYIFTEDGSPTNYIAKWDGNAWSALGSGFGDYSTVSALAVLGSDLYAGGRFNTAGGSPANHIAKWNGSRWSALGSGMVSGLYYDYYAWVSALAVSGSDLYVGGLFTRVVNGSAANNIAKWNGSSWSALGSGLKGLVSALAVSGSNLYVGGRFNTAGGSAATNIAKWDGSSWSALGLGLGNVPGESPEVSALAVSGSDLYVGGRFTTAGGNPATNIAKWDGSTWTALGSGISGGIGEAYALVSALAVSGSDLYVEGRFTTAGGNPATNVAKWDGSSWSAWYEPVFGLSAVELGLGNVPGESPEVKALAMSGSDLYVGGRFTTAGGSAATNIAKWDGNSWSALGSGIGNVPNYTEVKALAVLGSDLYAGGWFTTAGGKVSALIARAYLPALPTLSVLRSDENVTVSWPTIDTAGFALEQTGALAAPAGWVTNSATVTDGGASKSVTLPGNSRSQFFRLRRP